MIAWIWKGIEGAGERYLEQREAAARSTFGFVVGVYKQMCFVAIFPSVANSLSGKPNWLWLLESALW
jgi:hypothetical protein